MLKAGNEYDFLNVIQARHTKFSVAYFTISRFILMLYINVMNFE